MYSGGYRPSPRENVQYPVPGRPQDVRPMPWQQDRNKFSMKKDDDRGNFVKFEPRDERKRSHSPRKSRSPIRRNRSPGRERFKKHSPSPRSPRRSWALEKRRSPDPAPPPPPPPSWPGHQPADKYRPHFPGDDKSKQPVWEPRRIEDDRRFDDTQRDLGRPMPPPREPSPRGFKNDRFSSKEPKFEPRFEPREPKFEPREPKFEPRDPKFMAREPKFEPREEFRRPDDVPKRFERDFRGNPDDRHAEPRHAARQEEFPRREDERKFIKVPDSFNKELDDVYKRAVEFSKRTEELRRRDRRDEMERRDDHESKNFNRKYRDDRPTGYRDDNKQPDWKIEEKRSESPELDELVNMSPKRKGRRDKAVDELATKIYKNQGSYLPENAKERVMEELKLSVGKVLQRMFGNQEVSFIEMIIKFNSRVDTPEEVKMFNDVMDSLPSYYRKMKRVANEPGSSETPAKIARRDEPHVTQGWPRQLHSPSNPEKFVSPYVLKNKIRKGVVNNFNPAFKRPAEIDVSTQQKKIKDEEKVEKTEPVVQKELDPTMSRILEDELQQIMTKVWEELPASPACEAEKMVVDKLRREAGDDLKRLLGLNVTKRLLNVHNPIYVKVEFDIKPEGENLMQFLRWLNVTSMKRERGAGAGPGGAAGAGGAHHYLVQLRKISDYDRALRVKKIKFGTLKASITSGYNFEECPPKLKSIYSQRKTKEEYSHYNESETLSKKPNIIDETKKNQRNVEPHNKVDAKGDNTKKDEAVDKAKENNTDLKKTPTKPTVNKNPATQNKPQVSGTKKPEPAKNVAKVVTKPASVVKKNNDSVATSTHETNAKKETNVSNATVTKTGTAVAKNTAVKATAPQKATAEVSKVPAEKVKVQTAAKATKPVNQGLTPTTNKPAPKSKPAPKVTPKKTETKKKQVSDFDELDDEDILALMSNAIVLDECRGSDDEN